jgi:HD-GYP domain-containing protein (c-di-GMP phosphodiesterase class II)
MNNKPIMRDLPDSAQRLDAIFQAFDDSLFILDENGTILDCRVSGGMNFHGHAENFLQRKMQDIFPDSVSWRLQSAIQSIRAGSNDASFEYSLDAPAGGRWYEARMIPATGGQIIVFVRDITKYKQSEVKIRLQLDQLSALRKIDLAITSGLDLKLTLSMILEHVRAQLKIDAATILLLNPQTQMLEFAAGLGFKTNSLQHSQLKVGEGYAGQAVRERNVIHVANLQSGKTDFLRSPTFRDEKFTTYYGVPLIAKGQVLGVLEIFSRLPLTPDSGWLNFMIMLAGQASIAIDNAMLFRNLERLNAELTMAYDRTIEGWSRALQLRDSETEVHTRRVAEMSVHLARLMGISENELVQIRRGAILHDIGKVGIPDHILLKPGPLTDEEWELMRRHPLIAVDLISPIDYLTPALPIPRSHHEKWDGSGYPDGLAGEGIPLAARIFALVDVYDALTSARPYRAAWSRPDALDYIRSQSGRHFDPTITPLFINMIASIGYYP